MEIDKICRGCLRKGDKMINMTEKEIYQKFLLFTNLTAEEEISDVSLNLCQSCEQKLNISLDFKDECQKSHEILLNYVKNTCNADLEARIPLNDVKKTCEVDSEATAAVVANVKKPSRMELFSQARVSEAIKDLRRSCYKNLNCIRCSYVGSNLRIFSQHMTRMHKDLKSRWCFPCNAEFDNLTGHVETNHSNDYNCKFCSKKFHSINSIVSHLRNHSDSKPFRCSICEAGFIKQYHLNVHLNNHKEEKLYKCSLCEKLFTQMHWLKIHLKIHESKGGADKQVAPLELKTDIPVHTRKAADKCTYCRKKFKSPSDVFRHECTHTGEKPYVCQVCGTGFAETSGLKKHMIVHNLGPKIICNICNKKCSTLYNLRLHLRNHTGEKMHNRTHSNLRPYQCHNCNKSFRQKSLLIGHMLTHSGEKSFVCTQCGTGFIERTQLDRHYKICSNSCRAALEIKNDTKKELLKCKYCEKKFKLNSEMIRHERTHTGEKPYVCQVCGRGFAQTSSLKEHMMVVHNIGNKKSCNICSKTFSTQSKLRLHLRNHTGEKPFVCTLCGKGFIESYRLAVHNRTHSNLRLYQCYNCDKSFREKSAIRIHMLTHSGEKPYKCNQCSNAYRHSSNLTKHMMKHEVDKPQLDKPHVCLMCNRSFTTNALLTSHINRHNVNFLEIK